MSSQKIIIHNCTDCSFRHFNEWGPSSCNLNPDNEVLTEQVEACEGAEIWGNGDAGLPELCPLRKGMITCRLAKEK